MSLLKKDTYLQQASLAGYCRSGIEPSDLIGINRNNLYQYRRLVFNIASDILETAYPITFSHLEKQVWEDLVYNYFLEHKCQTTQVWRMPLEFYEYCRDKNKQEELNIPYLNDLLYFEWLEMEVHTMEDMEYPKTKTDGDWNRSPIALNPEHKLIPLTYPVHTTAPGPDLVAKKGNYFLLIYREKESGNVQFIDLSMFFTFVLENIKNGVLLEDILAEANTLFQVNDPELLNERSLHFINDLKQRNFIIGFLA